MASQARRDKEKFFAELYALDDLAGEDDEINRTHEAVRGTGHASRPSPRSSRRHSARPSGCKQDQLDEEASDDERHTFKHERKDVASREEMPPSPRLVTSAKAATSKKVASSKLRRAQTEDSATTKPAKKARKKGPEGLQIFAGQTFFFIPNDNRAVPRKRRIDKAVLHGATWARAWIPSVTHVIVESDKKMADVIKATGLKEFPFETNLVLDTWLTESLAFKETRDVAARRFEVPQSTPVTETVIDRDVRRTSPEINTGSRSMKEEAVVQDSQERPRDALDDFLEEAKATQHLPLDLDDDDLTPSASFADSETTTDEAYLDINKGFQCMLKNDGKPKDTNPNAITMGILQEMASFYDRTGDRWRTLSYKKAIAALRKQKTKIETKEQARAISQIGERLSDKIEEIVSTNKLRRLDSAKSDPREQAMHLFTGIYGVGPSVASTWIAQGDQTLDDIRKRVDLTPNQQIGLEHYADFQARIPRQEVAEHARIVQEALRKFDPEFQLIIGGSYRRGNVDSGDIDCLITKENVDIEHIRNLVMGSAVPFLTSIGFLKAALATARTDEGMKWHGASALPNSKIWRRLDLLFVPWNELGASLIYFTGNDVFNRSIRLLASKHGMRLNQRGLYKNVMRGKQRQRITDGQLMEGQSEPKIFSLLRVPWRAPEDRMC